MTALKLNPVLLFKWLFPCIKTWKPERICLCACCQLKPCLLESFYDWMFLLLVGWIPYTAMVSFPYLSFHRLVSFLVLAWHCLLLLGLISSSRAKAAGHSLSTLCMLSVPALPFFSKSRGNGLSCPPASRKWVIDDPWTFPRGYSVAVLQGHRHKSSQAP